MARKKQVITKLELSASCPYCGRYEDKIIINKLTSAHTCCKCRKSYWIEMQAIISPFYAGSANTNRSIANRVPVIA